MATSLGGRQLRGRFASQNGEKIFGQDLPTGTIAYFDQEERF